eukprot:g31404.t1
MSCWLGTLLSGLNFRKYHGFSSEDWIGQLKHCCWASQHASLEEFALKRWYTGFLGKVWAREDFRREKFHSRRNFLDAMREREERWVHKTQDSPFHEDLWFEDDRIFHLNISRNRELQVNLSAWLSFFSVAQTRQLKPPGTCGAPCHPSAATTDDPSTAVVTRPSCAAPIAAAAFPRTEVRNMVDASSQRDLREASVYQTFMLPKLYMKMLYCVSCAIHGRVVRVRNKVLRASPEGRIYKPPMGKARGCACWLRDPHRQSTNERSRLHGVWLIGAHRPRSKLAQFRQKEAYDAIMRRATAEKDDLEELRIERRLLVQGRKHLKAMKDVSKTNARAAQAPPACEDQQTSWSDRKAVFVFDGRLKSGDRVQHAEVVERFPATVQVVGAPEPVINQHYKRVTLAQLRQHKKVKQQMANGLDVAYMGERPDQKRRWPYIWFQHDQIKIAMMGDNSSRYFANLHPFGFGPTQQWVDAENQPAKGSDTDSSEACELELEPEKEANCPQLEEVHRAELREQGFTVVGPTAAFRCAVLDALRLANMLLGAAVNWSLGNFSAPADKLLASNSEGCHNLRVRLNDEASAPFAKVLSFILPLAEELMQDL